MKWVDVDLFESSERLHVSCSDEGLSGDTKACRLKLTVLQTVMDPMPQCVWQVRTMSIIRQARHSTLTHRRTDRVMYRCKGINTHIHTHTHKSLCSTYLHHRWAACHIRDGSMSSVRQPVICSTVTLLSTRETLSSLHLSQHAHSCPTASLALPTNCQG